MKVVGIDPGSHVLGYAVLLVLDPDAIIPCVSFVAAGAITSVRARPLHQRLHEIGAELEDALVESVSPGERVVCAIESGYVPTKKGAGAMMSALILGASRGVAMNVITRRFGATVDLREYAPASVKKAFAGNGRADKEQMATAAVHVLGLRRRPAPDVADAMGIAWCRAMHL